LKVNSEVKLIGPAPVLIAHRGYSGQYPENTLLAYKEAYEHGAKYMELDLQLSADRVPFVHHDANLKRMSGVDLDIRDTKSKQIKTLRASYPDRYGEEFANNKFTTLRKFTKWMKHHSDVTVFMEIKQESIDRFGLTEFVDQTYRRILDAGVESQCVIISFNDEVVRYTREISAMQVGWVLPKWNSANEAVLRDLNPNYMFCDKESLPKKNDDIWQGDWQWAIYNLDDVSSAIAMANRGFEFLETNQIGNLMADEGLANRQSE
jgi:glycerophosphoryl diester phosphodiesterase